ncbi:TonB-dependent receptor [Pedobacter sp. BS3]|uniref:SusC/RagA family TonB-linked outer membrane protein n=1 Tax=Pedobacter sp. BS3 TaxID=2567937 RepID=UPI0011EE6D49|nr:TonB-dependent receptor [Pedobacter sp. BS3]TZF83092.1 TonB-dependent receptor [Pedobacter sp. BS3]
MNKKFTRAFLPPEKAFALNAGRLRIFLLMAVLQLLITAVYAQSTIKVTGTVTDSKGEPLPGVSIKVKGTPAGTSTNANGKYTITVPDAKSVLTFTYVGFVTKEESVGSRTVINIKLSENVSDLDEVVVTGYGSAVRKRDLTGAIASVSSKDIQERQPVTLYDALQGQVAGALVMNDNGDPTGEGTIQIRGASTINASGTGPLYVIDGVISDDANFVNPADIESFEVLKDASSAAIYGARGANGVIIITTKRGQEGKPSITVQYTHTLGELAHKLPAVTAADLRYYRAHRDNKTTGAVADSVNHYMNQDNDFQDEMLRTAHKQVASLTLRGGQKGLTYYSGVNYTDDRSIVINSWAKMLQTKLNVDYQASPKLKISNNLAFAYQSGNDIPVGTSVNVLFDRNPWTSLYNPDGSMSSYVESKRNPVAYALYEIHKRNYLTAQYNIQLNYKIYKDLQFTTLFNAKARNNQYTNFSPKWLTSKGEGNASGTNELSKDFNWEYQAFFNYNKTLAGSHNITGMLGFSADRRRYDDFYFAMSQYLNETIYTSNAAGLLDLAKTTTFATANSDASLFGRLGYNYKGRYLVEGTYRRDGSSRFGSNNKYGNFFSGSAAWRFSDETFMKWSKSFLEDGKLRYSVGQTGNDAINDYGSVSLINFGDEFYNLVSMGALSTTMGNTNIKWESTTQQNLGLDLSLFKGKVSVSVDAYKKVTSNLLYDKKLPAETGFVSTFINLGTITNKGLEIAIGGTPVSKKDFQWSTNVNASFQQGKITKLADNSSFLSGDKWLIQEGGNIGDMYMFKNLGVYQYDVSNAYDEHWNLLTPVGVSSDGKAAEGYLLNGQPYTGVVQQMKDGSSGRVLTGGNTIWQDTDHNGVIDNNDKAILGNGVPKYYFGFVNNFRYKQFSLNVIFNGSLGYQVYNKVANGQNRNSSTYSPPTPDAIYNSWQKQGDIAKYPYFPNKDTYGDMRYGINSLYLEDGDFIRLSSAKLTYTLDNKIAKRFKAKSANVYVFGQNLATWTNYSWFDPEFSSKGLNIGEDSGKYPKRREIGLGVQLIF